MLAAAATETGEAMTPAQTAERLMIQLSSAVREARQAFPGAGYAGRIYFCDACSSYDGACAPAYELPDDYPCPICRAPQRPVTPAGLGPAGNRAQRRARR